MSLLLRNMVPVKSSCIDAAGYSAADHRLAIRFKSGRLKFYSAPVRIFQELMESASAGRYFNQRIKGKYGNQHTSQCSNRFRSDLLQDQKAEAQEEVKGLGADSKHDQNLTFPRAIQGAIAQTEPQASLSGRTAACQH